MAVGLREDDELVVVRPIREDSHIVLATADGYSIRFACKDVRPMGRVATGVKGIALRRQDVVVAGVILKENDQTTEIMSISANGFGKRTRVDLYRLQSRGGKGIINFKVTSKTGPVVGAMPVRDNDGLIMLTSANKVVRIGVEDVRSKGRATMGVMLVRLDEGAHVVGFDRVDEGGQTGSRMDDIVYEEFKGTGNMEIHLDRKLSEKRIFPAIDIYKSGTRRDDLLLSPDEMDAVYIIRKMLGNGNPADVLLTLLDNLGFTDNYMECMIPTNGVYPIATANDKENISKPIMSRFAVIDIPDYTPDEKKEIFNKFVLPKVLKRIGLEGSECIILPEGVDAVIKKCDGVTGIRDIEQAAEHIVAHALYQIEVNHVQSVTFDGGMIEELLS